MASDTDPNNKKQISNKLVCITYPGIVNNVDKALETLGGMHTIQEVLADNSRKLELQFRPSYRMCKPTMASKETKSGILLKVKIPRQESNEVNRDNGNGGLEYEIEGVTAVRFKFERLCDFQYLPLLPENGKETKDSKLEYTYKKYVPDELPNKDWFESEDIQNIKSFLIPTSFTRYDSPHCQLSFPKVRQSEMPLKEESTAKPPSKKLSRTSKSALLPSKIKGVCKIISIKTKEVPQKPHKTVDEIVSSGIVRENEFLQMKQLFEERPIWSRPALQHKLDLSNNRTRSLLPLLGYFFTSGPWRKMWVKYGYDPRLDPEARKYQTFDFRIRTRGGLKLGVDAKRSYPSGSYQFKKFSLQEGLCTPKKTVDETHYILGPNMVPPARQMSYQYCDIHLPEIQAMLTKLPPVSHMDKCDDKNGWLPGNFHDQCREIVNKYVTKLVQSLLDKKEESETTSASKPEEAGEGDLFEISDSEEDSENEDINNPLDFESEGEDSEGDDSEGENDDKLENIEDDDNEIDIEAVHEVNKLLGIEER